MALGFHRIVLLLYNDANLCRCLLITLIFSRSWSKLLVHELQFQPADKSLRNENPKSFNSDQNGGKNNILGPVL